MEGIAKITKLKMKNARFKSYVTVTPDGNEYVARFINYDKSAVCSQIRNIQEFIIDALEHGWKITLLEVE